MSENAERAGGAPPTVSEAQLLSVLDTAVDGIVVMDDRGRIILYNKACETLFGYTADEVRGKNVKVLMPADYARAHDGYVSNYLSTGEKKIIGIGREVRARHRDGTEFPIELSVGEAKTPDGRQFIGIMRDIRSRKQVERRVAELQSQLVSATRISALDEMGAAIAHELNQPLTAIMLYLQAAKRKVAAESNDGKLVEIVDKGVREAERASQIIQRMRRFVEKREPERRQVFVPRLIEESLELVQLGTAVDGLSVEIDVPEELPEISIDPVQIQQVLINLLRNAVQAVREASIRRIGVSAAAQDHDIVIRITDSGGGVPAEVVPTLFKAFSGQRKGGLGLGLAISRSIAQNHGGDLSVEPKGSELGAAFVLRLPIDTTEQSSQDEEGTSS
ncbi:MAG: PAS domain-containing sensor histidine kinase [Stappia sp.]|uniref:two-component system sensor histidine kinase NtrB n=1 Tax=Stappia sp. TaxID=1870903 RepID=UPI000C365653|nr:PAS domain S-box protein [Stappia sp.]MBM18602.1 PAS domain-containing sensor histidine kinase [Stappia sp.]